ncbi:MAG TPA: TolC family protein, partial [Bacteroidia bacterium]|nr:TolC family protein [Bacteroidia bacterium]
MKKIFLIGILAIIFSSVHAQTSLNLDSCYAQAKAYYPLIKEEGLIEKTKDYTISNAAKGYLPQVNFSGQATYQSAVTTIPIDFHIPGVNFSIPTVSQSQFNLHGEVDQTIYDGGMIKQQKSAQTANANVQEQNIEVQLYQLKNRINQLFFGTLLIDAQIKQNDLTQKDLQNSINKVQAGVTAGSVLASSLDELQAELYQLQQNEIGLKTSRKAYMDMLSLFINRPLDENTSLQTPINTTVSDSIHRPELSFYDFQKKSDDVQEKILNASNRPKFLFFFQGGYALPGLNGFDINPALYYVTGVRLSWNLGGLYTLKNQRQLLAIDRQSIDVQKENFLFNTR